MGFSNPFFSFLDHVATVVLKLRGGPGEQIGSDCWFPKRMEKGWESAGGHAGSWCGLFGRGQLGLVLRRLGQAFEGAWPGGSLPCRLLALWGGEPLSASGPLFPHSYKYSDFCFSRNAVGIRWDCVFQVPLPGGVYRKQPTPGTLATHTLGTCLGALFFFLFFFHPNTLQSRNPVWTEYWEGRQERETTKS